MIGLSSKLNEIVMLDKGFSVLLDRIYSTECMLRLFSLFNLIFSVIKVNQVDMVLNYNIQSFLLYNKISSLLF